MKSKFVLEKNSAFPYAMKMKCLTQEVFRRLHNTSENILEENKGEILSKFTQKLKNSGYNEKERLNIIKGGIKTHQNLKDLEKVGKRNYYRSPIEREIQRKKKKDLKQNWFRKGDNKNKFTTVIFVEFTPNGELINLLREIEERNKIDENNRVKFVEKSGTKLLNKISISDPFRENCKEVDCLACKNSKKKFTNCRKSNVGYTIICKTCKEEEKTSVYEGETARNMYNRSKEHVKLLENKNENSPLYKHIKQKHNENFSTKFEMKLAGCFKTPLQRITNEGVRIKNREDNQLMSSKKEFFGPSVKRK